MDNKEIINIIPSKDISFKTRSLLSQILSRLELTNQDRLDLEKYITFGGGENLDYVKDNLKNIEYIKDNFEDFIKWKDKILNIVKDAPEEFDTLIEIFNYIEQHIQDAPFEKGASENSAVLKGGNIAGLKGFYVNAINGDSIYISEVNTEISENIPSIDEQFDNPYAVGDEYSLQLGEIYYNLGVITSINHNLMVVSNLKPIKYDDRLRYYFYVTFKPSLGVVDLGLYTSALGFENSANDFCAHSEGWKNKSIGKYSHTEGKENEAHYCAHVEGSNNIASGNTSHAEGTDNRALNSNTHVEGRYTSAKGYASHAEGQGESLTNPNLAEGNYSHVEGEKTKSRGIASHSEGMLTEAGGKAAHSEGRQTKTTNDYTHAEGYLSEAGGIGSHVEGVGTQTKNNGEHAEGRFNKSNSVAPNEGSNPKNTLHSVGIGASDTDRKNAHEIMQDGKHYIYGIGGYDGTNPNGSEDVATVITRVSATPDWNAREGEDGYINNKPFYDNVDYVINKGGEYKNVHNESNVIFNNKILFNLRDIVDNDVITIISGPPVTLEKRYESDGTITLIIEDIGNYLSTHPIIIGDLVTIPEIFIPDTIARKSDIVVDPTVWKYLCNPLIIEEGTEVPDELYDEDRDWLKYEYPAMYRFYDGMEFKFCAKADYNRLTDSKDQDWYINMKTFYLE